MEKGIASLVQATSCEYEHIILCITKTGRSEELLPAGTKVLSLEKPDGNSIRFIFKLAKILKDLNPDVVHTRNWGGLDGVLAARLAGISGVVHGEHGWGVIDTNGLQWKRVIIRRLISFFTKEYTCVSKQMVQWLKNDISVKKPITQIYNGIDFDRYRPSDTNESANRVLIGIVGRLDPIKDHSTLFTAFQIVIKAIPDVELLVIGDGPEREKLENNAGIGISFLGNRRDIPKLLQTLDVFVLSSLNEGISNTILEAMATAIPVIASNVGGNPELVEDGITGRLFEPGDSEGLASIILDYCHNTDKRKLHGREARKKVMKKFSMDKMINQYIEVWERISEQ
ncbi:MAG: glycosyltransferase [Desulfobacula sp.]|nr:glycosyltransferase [Desulfobacula sp.]